MLYDFTSVREKFPWRKDLLNKDAICLQAYQEKTKSGETNCPLIFWVFHMFDIIPGTAPPTSFGIHKCEKMYKRNHPNLDDK